MRKPLHILNGDALADRFPSALSGDRLVFRECLVDGPIKAANPQELQALRSAWMEAAYGIPQKESMALGSPCYTDLEQKGSLQNRRVYLWFEDDLFCQINAWYAVQRLRVHGVAQAAWVRAKSPKRHGFGGMDQQALTKAFSHAQALGPHALDVLAAAWWMFRNDRSKALQHWGKVHNNTFPWLRKATECAALLLDDAPDGPRKRVDRLIEQQGPDAGFGPVFRAFSRQAPEYGLGDLQVHRYWRKAIALRQSGLA